MTGERTPFEYVLIRAVPRVDRGESVNLGVVLYSQAHDFLGFAHHLDETRVHALAADADLEAIADALAGIEGVCAGGGAEGSAAAQPLRVRFGWLAAPRSTVVQPGPVHTGMTADPAAELARLLDRLVR